VQNESDFWSSLYANAAASPPKIAFSDAQDHRVLQAVSELSAKNLVSPVLVTSASLDAKQRARLAARLAETLQNAYRQLTTIHTSA
jgi:phosphotransacetylase